MPKPIKTGLAFRSSNWDYVALVAFVALVWAIVGGVS